MIIQRATTADLPDLLRLVNSAFRGDSARQGWTHEADLLQGEQRTDAAELGALLQNPQIALLTYKADDGQLLGCVNLQTKPRGLYLGMLTVAPDRQGEGIGKLLLKAAEDYARQLGCPCIFMTVFSVRQELLDWYIRHGYRLTGETQDYPSNPVYGVPTQPLHFVVLEKVMD